MGREILFRGKRVDNGEWVEGLLWKKKYHSNKIFISYFPDEDDYEEVVAVSPETVGQYTGLKDKNGRKIFEGDVLAYQHFRDDKVVGKVVWGEYNQSKCDEYCCNHYGWHIDNVERDYYDDTGVGIINMKHVSLEVIGNAFDNPELLGGEHE